MKKKKYVNTIKPKNINRNSTIIKKDITRHSFCSSSVLRLKLFPKLLNKGKYNSKHFRIQIF